ncbi:MAG: hypothetical protein MHMPM18_003619 [Marteilia pararefringens]
MMAISGKGLFSTAAAIHRRNQMNYQTTIIKSFLVKILTSIINNKRQRKQKMHFICTAAAEKKRRIWTRSKSMISSMIPTVN